VESRVRALATVQHVVLPQALPAIGASFFIAMAVSWDEFVIAWFLSGFDVTLPVKLFGVVNGYVSPTINAIGTIVFAITAALVVLALLAMRLGNTKNSTRSELS
jgi:spermidine/putrescine transport system permease protein